MQVFDNMARRISASNEVYAKVKELVKELDLD